MSNTGETITVWSATRGDWVHPGVIADVILSSDREVIVELVAGNPSPAGEYRAERVAEIIDLDHRRRARASMSAAELQAWLND